MGIGDIAKKRKPTAASRALAQSAVNKSKAAGLKMIKDKPPPKPTWKQIGKRVAKKMLPVVAAATLKREQIRKKATGGK